MHRIPSSYPSLGQNQTLLAVASSSSAVAVVVAAVAGKTAVVAVAVIESWKVQVHHVYLQREIVW